MGVRLSKLTGSKFAFLTRKTKAFDPLAGKPNSPVYNKEFVQKIKQRQQQVAEGHVKVFTLEEFDNL
ncbi:DUF2683 family protein [Spirosoma sp. 48-14]|uniref:DUF2683 family protein n=1 Tax=Spirosoma sp. 48-14 TaxID=1895854 RepID=UPI0009655B2C|nr:DUF2683 family protein [Spirosoma sp. 48-14]OJW78446.1 MAG: hypothetical protein BGO59_31070 [Spirosoma sp. 48-14]